MAARVGDAVGGADLGGAAGPRVGASGAPSADIHVEQERDRLLVGGEVAQERRLGVLGLERIGEDRRHPGLDRLGQADPEIEPERACDLLAEERAQRLAARPPHHLADRPAEGEAVIAVARAGLPERLFGGEQSGHIVPVVGSIVLEACAQRRHAGRVVEHHARGDVFLAVLAELGPQLDHRCIEIELTATRQHMGAQRRRAVGAGEHHAHRVGLPRRAGLRIGDAAP